MSEGDRRYGYRNEAVARQLAEAAQGVSDQVCEAEWWFDVDFDVMCTLPPSHDGAHEAHIEGNGRIEATVTWGGDQT